MTARRAIVVGGSRGIGLAVAARLAAEDHAVAIVARDAARLEEAARSIPHDVSFAVADTRDTAQVERAVAELADRLGGLDVIVNSGYTPHGLTRTEGLVGGFTEDDLREAFETKFLGYFRVARAAVPWLRESGSGRIINIAGRSVGVSTSLLGAVRNAPVAALTSVLAAELAPDRITVNVVHPGPTHISEGPPDDPAHATADEVARVVTFLASPEAGVVTGESISIGREPGTAIRTYS